MCGADFVRCKACGSAIDREGPACSRCVAIARHALALNSKYREAIAAGIDLAVVCGIETRCDHAEAARVLGIEHAQWCPDCGAMRTSQAWALPKMAHEWL